MIRSFPLWFVCRFQAGGHEVLSLIDFFLEFPFTDFGDAVAEIKSFIYIRFPDSLCEKDEKYGISNRWLDQKNLLKPKMRLSRMSRRLSIEYITTIQNATIPWV